MQRKYQHVLIGLLMGLLTLVVAEFMASSFGLYEKDIKAALLEEALEHTHGVTVPGHEHEDDAHRKIFKDRKEAEQVANKAWVYLKRAHSHGEGLGIIAIALSLLIANTLLKPMFKKALSISIGLGCFFYPLSWFYAGTFMVDKGKAVAKSEIHLLAVSSVTLYLGALLALCFLLALYSIQKHSKLSMYFFSQK